MRAVPDRKPHESRTPGVAEVAGCGGGCGGSGAPASSDGRADVPVARRAVVGGGGGLASASSALSSSLRPSLLLLLLLSTNADGGSGCCRCCCFCWCWCWRVEAECAAIVADGAGFHSSARLRWRRSLRPSMAAACAARSRRARRGARIDRPFTSTRANAAAARLRKPSGSPPVTATRRQISAKNAERGTGGGTANGSETAAAAAAAADGDAGRHCCDGC